MRLKRFHAICARLRADLPQAVKVLRQFNGKWYDENGGEVADPKLSEALERTLQGGRPWRPKNSYEAYFPLPTMSAVAVISYPAYAKQTTLDATATAIETSRTQANSAFDLAHDELTQCLNRRAIDTLLGDLITSTASTPESGGSATASMPSREIYLLALDLDRFKQINDSYGHLYGDLVLRAFAWRVEEACAELRQISGVEHIELGRPGGEEFSVVLCGRITRAEAERAATAIKECVHARSLPSDTELETFKRDGLPEGASAPTEPDRRVSVSVGVANAQAASSEKNISRVASILKHQADVALYSAKVGGRNCVRFFEDIVTKYGHVLEHHSDTDIVTIDIGRDVGVRVGQEFRVFHPDFSGNIGFYQSDGRTNRRLGTYPRIASGSLVAFDVQDEISFCRVQDRQRDGLLFAKGANLEAIPLGSITHLLRSLPGKGSLIEESSIKKVVEATASAKVDTAFAVFELRDPEQLGRDRGSVFVNEQLARLHTVIATSLPPAASVAQLGLNRFVAAWKTSNPEQISEAMIATLERARSEMSPDVFVTGGVFHASRDAFQDTLRDLSGVDARHAIEYASLAAAGAKESFNWRPFDVDTLSSLINLSRQRREYARAIADFELIQALGLKSAPILNGGALAIVENRQLGDKLEVVERYLKEAIALAPKTPIYSFNLGHTYFYLNRFVDALPLFEAAGNPLEVQDFPVAYLGAYGHCLIQRAHSDPSVNLDRAVAAVRKALEVPANQRTWGTNDDLQADLAVAEVLRARRLVP